MYVYIFLPKMNEAISFIFTVTCNQSGHEELSPSSGKSNITSDNIPIVIVKKLCDDIN